MQRRREERVTVSYRRRHPFHPFLEGGAIKGYGEEKKGCPRPWLVLCCDVIKKNSGAPQLSRVKIVTYVQMPSRRPFGEGLLDLGADLAGLSFIRVSVTIFLTPT